MQPHQDKVGLITPLQSALVLLGLQVRFLPDVLIISLRKDNKFYGFALFEENEHVKFPNFKF